MPTVFCPRWAQGRPAACHRCEAFRPEPQLSGNLQVDPDIHLPLPGMDVDVAFYYNSAAAANFPLSTAPDGYKRTISPAQAAQALRDRDDEPDHRARDRRRRHFRGRWHRDVQAGSAGLLTHGSEGRHRSRVPAQGDHARRDVTACPLNVAGLPTTGQASQGRGRRPANLLFSGGLLASVPDAGGTAWLLRLLQQAPPEYPGLGRAAGPLSVQHRYRRSQEPADDSDRSDRLPDGLPVRAGRGEPGLAAHRHRGSQRVMEPATAIPPPRQIATRAVAGVGTHSYTYGTGTVQTQDPTGSHHHPCDERQLRAHRKHQPAGFTMLTLTRNANNQETNRADPFGEM